MWPKALGCYHQQINIRVRPCTPPCLGTKQHNLFWGYGLHNGLCHLL